MFTEYQIRASLILTLKKALADMDVSNYKVLARNPQNMTYDTDCVLIDKINVNRIGFQGHQFEKIGEKFVEKEEWIEEITWQISVIHRREVDDTIESLTGEDVAQRLIAWLNSARGASEMRHRKDVPFAPVYAKKLRNRAYKSDSDVYQIEPSFDFRMIVLQLHPWEVRTIDQIMWEIYHI